MGWQIGETEARSRQFMLHPDAEPAELLPKCKRSGGEPDRDKNDRATGVIEPGSPNDPCRELHLAYARTIEAAQRFPDAYAAILQALDELRGVRT